MSRDVQGKQFGLRVIQALDHIAEQMGCYKAILDCSEKNEGFYVKCGYKRAGVQMVSCFPPAPGLTRYQPPPSGGKRFVTDWI